MIQLATLKGKSKTKGIAGIKPKPEHFAILELDIPKRRSTELSQTEIAPIEVAIHEFKLRKAMPSKVAAIENAIFVLAFCQRGVPVKRPVLNVCIFHSLNYFSRSNFPFLFTTFL